MKKMQLLMGLLFAGAVFLTACGGTSEKNTETGDTSSAKDTLFAEEDGSTWRDKWQIETASGEAVNVNLCAWISTFGQKQMSTVDVKKYEFSDENIKKLTDIVFDEKSDDTKGKTETKKEKGKVVCKERTITGKRNGIQYDLKFTTTNYSEKEEYIELIPKDIKDIAPDSIKDKTYISCSSGWADQSVKEQKNACKLTKSEASKMAQQFLDDTGFSDWMLVSGNDLCWEGENDSYGNNGNVSEQKMSKDGYRFEYSVGVEGLAFYQCGVKSVGSYTIKEIGGEEVKVVHENDEYSRQCYLTVDVTDAGVVQAEWNNPLEILSVTSDVKLLSFDQIKDVIKNEMKEYAEYYYNKNKLHVSFDRMQLVYYRMDSPDKKDYYTYIPAWVLWSKSNLAAYFVNAMDGSVIKDWDGDWDFDTSI